MAVLLLCGLSVALIVPVVLLSNLSSPPRVRWRSQCWES